VNNKHIIGVDIGASKIATVIVTSQGEVIATNKTLTKSEEGYKTIVAHIVYQINELIDQTTGDIAGIGIGVPGLIDSDQRIVIDALNLGWYNVPLVSDIERGLLREIPIFVMMDTKASALGEYRFGAGKGCKDFFYLAIGSGLGGAVIANGQLVIGAHGIAGAVGHFALFPDGRLCACGLRGCPETVVSGIGLLNIVREYLTEHKYQTNLVDSADLSPKSILNAARHGDELASAAFTEVGQHLAIVMSAVVAVLNPSMIIIGGGLGLAAYDIIVPIAEGELKKRVLPPFRPGFQIQPSALESSAIGAACLVLMGES
jgi:glucokinase